MDFVQNILNIARERGYTNKQLCELLGKNSSYISDWKSGKSKPKADEIILLAKEFNVTTDYLLGRSESEKTDIDFVQNTLDRNSAGQKIHKLNDLVLSKEEKELIIALREFSPDYKSKVLKLIDDIKAEIEKDRKLDMLIEQNRKLIYGGAAAYGGETSDVILTPEEDAKIDELLRQERERKAKNGDDIL